MFNTTLKLQMQQLLALAEAKNIKISCAESCTGGVLSALFTEISGSSKVFDRGFITYSNQSKQEMLGVKPETLQQFGAVSAETAQEMAQGAIKKSTAQISIAITGIAGPEGGSEQKPVGLVYICCSGRSLFCRKFNFFGNRTEVRMSAVREALKMLVLEVERF